jgi:broad specificity phosphatase PhoE
MRTRLVLCRHAEPAAWDGNDPGLSERGLEQARLLAEGLASVPIATVYSSPARRALATAQPIGARHGLRPLPFTALRELDFGELTGLGWEELEEREPELAAALLTEPARVRFPGGESYGELRARAASAAQELIARHVGETIVAVSHAGPIRALLATWLLMAEEAIFRLEPAYAAINLIDWIDGIPLVRALNVRSPPEEVTE